MKHSSLPQSLTPELLGEWLVQNHKEKFTEEKRIYYTEEELNEFKNKAVSAGIEINNLGSLKAKVSKLLDNGSEDYIQIDILKTKGIKVLRRNREACEMEVERGYRVEEIKIYGIPNQETRMMDFFDIEGTEIPERARPLSAKEMLDYFGMFASVGFNQKQA